tara:strand:+ start:3037 stop:4770 length:1734 start_codon:yes stop_codon:yes gene_type:complete
MLYFAAKGREELKPHLIFLSILSLSYLIPFFLTGQLITRPNDLLEKEIVCDHILGMLYKGDFQSVKLLLGGELEWYMMWRVFQPLSLLYGILETEVAFWTKDIIVKIFAYILFFKLAKKLNCTNFNSALSACLFACYMTQTELGLGLAASPYLIYLLLKNKDLKLKHYFTIIFIGLNLDLVRHGSIMPMVFLASFILFPKNQKYNFKLFFKIVLVLSFFSFLSNSNLIYSLIFSGPFHRSEILPNYSDLVTNLNNLFRNFFSIPIIEGNPYFFRNLPFNISIFSIVLISFFSKNKTSYFLLLIVFFISFFEFFSQLEFFANIKNNSTGLIKTLNWHSLIVTNLPLLHALLFVNITKAEIAKVAKYFVYSLLFLSIFLFQIRLSAVPIGKHFMSFDNLDSKKQNQLVQLFYSVNYNSLIKEMIKLRKDKTKHLDQTFKSKYTFQGYYDYENYKFIKSLVGASRTISIGLDPMVAVMNNINALGGYYNMYPLSYKFKFRKVIEKQIDHYQELKKYYDNWGHRVYTFVKDPSVIKIDFSQAKLLGAEYVISKYQISNKSLIPVCENCNNASDLFLYKINI